MYEGERNAMLGIFPTTYVDILPQDTVVSQVSTLSKKEKNYDGAAKAKFNFTARRKMHQLNWLRSFVEQLRCGGMDEDGNEKSGGAMLRLRNTLANKRWVRHYADTVCHLHPKPPITGTSLPERRGVAKHIVKKGKHTYIMALPNSEPVSLYLPRPYELLPPRSIPMPEPGAKTVAKAPSAPNAFIPEAHAAAWFERFMARTARDAITNAVTQVVAVTPLPEKVRLVAPRHCLQQLEQHRPEG